MANGKLVPVDPLVHMLAARLGEKPLELPLRWMGEERAEPLTEDTVTSRGQALVLLEELTWPVDQKAVQLSAESQPGSETEIGSERVEHGPERPIPAAAVDLDPASRDLLRVAHPPIEQGLLAPSVASRSRLAEEVLRLIALDREVKRPDARDGKNENVGRGRPPGGKRTGSDPFQQTGNPLARRRRRGHWARSRKCMSSFLSARHQVPPQARAPLPRFDGVH